MFAQASCFYAGAVYIGTDTRPVHQGTFAGHVIKVSVAPTPAPALESIIVTSAAPSLARGQVLQFTATGGYSDGSTQDVTATVTWASSSPAVPGIGSAGRATGLSAGQTTVSATLGAVSGNTALTVSAAVVSPPAPPAPPPVSFIVTGAGPGDAPEVKGYDARTGRRVYDFGAFAPFFTGGVRVAAGDVTGDGVPDIVCGAGPGDGPQVNSFDAATLGSLDSFFAYSPTYTGGVFLGAG